MKKTIIVTVCTLLLFGGGLCCWHLIAQNMGESFGWGALVFDDIPDDTLRATPLSLLERKTEEYSERELLELKVVTYRNIARRVAVHAEVGSIRGSAYRLADSHANLAGAMVELYRHTGEQEKLRISLQARVEAHAKKIEAITDAVRAGVPNISLLDLHEAEIQLLDALLEQKRTLAALDGEK